MPAARLVIQKRCSGTAAASMRVLYDWPVVTVEGLLEELFESSEDELLELSDDELESSDDVV